MVTATYNWSSVLRCAIESVRAQTYADWELVIVGDGNTDDSEAVVASFADSRIRWFNLPQNTGGQSMPNNLGIANARGRYIAYHGHDDLWLPSHLEDLVNLADRSGADLVYSLTETIGPAGSGLRYLNGVTASGGYEPGLRVVPSSLMHRRTLTEDIGPWKHYTEVTIGADDELVQRAADGGYRLACTGRLTVFKFPSAWRPNSYRDRRDDEQRAYWERIVNDPDFVQQETWGLLVAYATRVPPKRWRGLTLGRGRMNEKVRELRGLPPLPLPPIEPWRLPLVGMRRGWGAVRAAVRAVRR